MDKQYRSIEEIQADILQPDADLEKLEAELNEVIEARNAEAKAIEKREELQRKALAMPTAVEKFEERKEIKMEQNEVRDLGIASVEYRDAWLKTQMGIATEVEKRSVAMTNAAGVIPVITNNKIFDLLKQKAMLLNEVSLTRVNGAVNVPVEGTNNDAALHTENALMDAAADTWTNIQLSAFEITKFVRVSKSLMTMAVDAFEGYLVNKIADKLAQKIETYILYGTGSGQPKGIDKAQTWSDGSNGVDWASTAPTAAELIELVSYLPGAHYANAKWVMNHKTFFSFVYALRDDAKYPLVREAADGYYILGKKLLFSDFVADGEIFVGDFQQVVANLSQDISVDRSDASGFAYNAIDFRGSCLFDCDIAIPTAFVKSEATLA